MQHHLMSSVLPLHDPKFTPQPWTTYAEPTLGFFHSEDWSQLLKSVPFMTYFTLLFQPPCSTLCRPGLHSCPRHDYILMGWTSYWSMVFPSNSELYSINYDLLYPWWASRHQVPPLCCLWRGAATFQPPYSALCRSGLHTCPRHNHILMDWPS